MQAIHTKYIPATDTRAAKIKAYNESNPRGVLVNIDYEKDDLGRHFVAAREFIAKKLKFVPKHDHMVYGGSADGKGYVFCFPMDTIEVTE